VQYQVILPAILWNVTKLFAARLPLEYLRFPYCHCTLPGSIVHQSRIKNVGKLTTLKIDSHILE